MRPVHITEAEELPQGGVVMYCNRWCPDCKKARQWLEDQRINYIEVDVNTNSKASEQVRKWADGDLITPTFNINGTVVVDWDEARMAHLLLKK